MSSVSETPMFTIEDSRAVLEAVPGNIRSSTTAKSTLEERDGEVGCRIAPIAIYGVGRVNAETVGLYRTCLLSCKLKLKRELLKIK